MFKQFLKVGCVVFGALSEVNCEGMLSSNVDREKLQHTPRGILAETRSAQIDALLAQKCGSAQNAKTAVNQMVQALIREARSNEYVRKVLGGPNRERIGKSSKRVLLIAQLLISQKKNPEDLYDISNSMGIRRCGQFLTRELDNQYISDRILLDKYSKLMSKIQDFTGKGISAQEKVIVEYAKEKSSFNLFRKSKQEQISYGDYFDEIRPLPSYRSLNFLMFLIAHKGFLHVYNAYIKDNPSEKEYTRLADIAGLMFSAYDAANFDQPCYLHIISKNARLTELNTNHMRVKSDNKEFQNHSALSMAVKRFAILILNADKSNGLLDEQVLMYTELIQRITSALLRHASQGSEYVFDLRKIFSRNCIFSLIGFDTNLDYRYHQFLSKLVKFNADGTKNENSVNANWNLYKKLLNKVSEKDLVTRDVLKIIAEEKGLSSAIRAKQFVDNVLSWIVDENINILQTDVNNGKGSIDDGHGRKSDQLKQWKKLKQDGIPSDFSSKVLSHVCDFFNKTDCAQVRRCLKTKIPSFKSNGQERTSGEAYSDCLFLLFNDVWKKGKVSGDVLKQAFQLGRELQEKGIIDEKVNNGFINRTWDKIGREGWSGVYPRLATK